MTINSEEETIQTMSPNPCSVTNEKVSSKQVMKRHPINHGFANAFKLSYRTTHLIFILLYLAQVHLWLARCDVVIISPTNQTAEIFDDAELAFGSVPSEGISGKMVLSDPEDACSELKIKPPNQQDTWFLLARRYPCKFETKVRNAAMAGFKAIVIYSVDPPLKQAIMATAATPLTTTTTTLKPNDDGQNVNKTPQMTDPGPITTLVTPSSSSYTKSLNEVDTHIPTVLISYIDGEDLKQEYLYDKGFTVLILPRIPFPLNAYLLPFAIVIIVCLFMMVSFLVFQVIKCIRDRRKLSRHRLTNKQLRQLLTTYYTKGSQYDTCAICLEEYTEGERLRVLPCGHGYHLRCIDPWLTKSRRICPVCKGKVRVSGMNDISDTESESGQSTAPQQRTRYNNANESTPLLREQRQNPSRQAQQPQPLGQIRSHNHSRSSHHQQGSAASLAPSRREPPSADAVVVRDAGITGVYGDDNSSMASSTPNSRRFYLDAEQL